MSRCPLISTLFPYTTLFRSIFMIALKGLRTASAARSARKGYGGCASGYHGAPCRARTIRPQPAPERRVGRAVERSEEHTSELQSPCNLVCRLLLEKKHNYHD